MIRDGQELQSSVRSGNGSGPPLLGVQPMTWPLHGRHGSSEKLQLVEKEGRKGKRILLMG